MIVRTEEEVQSIIAQLNERRQQPQLKLACNEQVKVGYREALRVLCDKDESLQHIAEHCESVQARCIAWLAVDYLHGQCEANVLLNIPLKTEHSNERIP